MVAIRSLTSSPFGVALLYGVFGAIYIMFSDSVLTGIAGGYDQYQKLQTYKGWAFIILTSAGLWFLMRQAWHRLSETAQGAINAEDRLRLALTEASGLVWQVRKSLSTRAIDWQVSGGLARGLGLPEGKWIGLDEMLSHLHPSHRGYFNQSVERIFAGDTENSSPVLRFLGSDGFSRWVKFVLNPKSRMGTTELTMGGVAFDLTEQRQIAQDLEEVIFGAELGTWRLDVASGRNKINDRYAEMLGYSRAELEPMSANRFLDLVHPDDRKPLLASQSARYQIKDYLLSDEIRMRHKDGHWVWILTRCRPVEVSSAGEPLVLSGVHIDITRRKELEEQLKVESDFMRQLTETSISGILTVNETGRVSFANREAANILGMTQDELTGVSFQNDHWSAQWLDGTPLAPADFPFASVLKTQSTIRDQRVSIRFREGSRKILSINAAPMVLPDGKLQVVASVTDITTQLANEGFLSASAAEAKYASLHDPMTGLPNRELFEDYLTVALATTKQTGSGLMHVFLDIDNFKQVNDRFGNGVGDLLIRRVADRLDRLRQGNQTLARVAGDEFTFLHPYDRKEDTNAVLRSLSSALEEPFDLEGRVVHVTASMGVSFYPEDGDSSQDLWLNSDLAMNEAKARGRNRVVQYTTTLRDRQMEEARTAQILPRAIKARAFKIVLQPLLRLDGSGRLDGAEALLRCTDADLQGIGPAEFLAVAERTGLMRSVDFLVVDLVGEAAARLRQEGFNLRISINLSPDSLQQISFGQDLLSRLERAKLSSRDVRFELTEGALVELSSHARETLDLMHSRGFELSADDFGTGYSSLSYLQKLRLKEIKIDRSFTERLGLSEEPSDEIVRAILAMGQALGLRVVAEGIETERQFDWLSRHGCTLGQGFLFGRGVDLDSFVSQHLRPAAPE